MREQFGRVIGVFIVACFLAAPLVANVWQQGKIVGRVTDVEGAHIPRAQVVIVNIKTGQEYSVKAGFDGAFVVSGVPLGAYSIRVSSLGFKNYMREGVIIQEGHAVVLDLVMEVGPEAEVVVIQQADALSGTAPGLGREVLSSLIGEWFVEGTYNAPWSDYPPSEKIRGTISCRWGLDGVVLTQLWSVQGSPEGIGKLDIHFTFYWDAILNRYRLVWADDHTNFQLLEGVRKDGKLIFEDPSNPEGERPSWEIVIKKISIDKYSLTIAGLFQEKTYHFFSVEMNRK